MVKLSDECALSQNKVLIMGPYPFYDDMRIITYRNNMVAIACLNKIFIYKIHGDQIIHIKTYDSGEIVKKMVFLTDLNRLVVLHKRKICIYSPKTLATNYLQTAVSDKYDHLDISPDNTKILLSSNTNTNWCLIDTAICIRTDEPGWTNYASFGVTMVLYLSSIEINWRFGLDIKKPI